jgi:hypothetical protein
VSFGALTAQGVARRGAPRNRPEPSPVYRMRNARRFIMSSPPALLGGETILMPDMDRCLRLQPVAKEGLAMTNLQFMCTLTNKRSVVGGSYSDPDDRDDRSILGL